MEYWTTEEQQQKHCWMRMKQVLFFFFINIKPRPSIITRANKMYYSPITNTKSDWIKGIPTVCEWVRGGLLNFLPLPPLPKTRGKHTADQTSPLKGVLYSVQYSAVRSFPTYSILTIYWSCELWRKNNTAKQTTTTDEVSIFVVVKLFTSYELILWLKKILQKRCNKSNWRAPLVLILPQVTILN